MSYHYFSDSAITSATSPVADSTVLMPDQHLTPGEQVVFNAELTQSYLHHGILHQVDIANAERQAMLHGFQSDIVLDQHHSPYEAGTEAGSHIKQALLTQSYLDNGHVTYSDMIHANTQSNLQGPLEQYNFNASVGGHGPSHGGDFVRNSCLTESYLDHGHWNLSDVINADLSAQSHGPLIDCLF